MKKFLPIYILFLIVLLPNHNAHAYTAEGFNKYIKYVSSMARREGVRESTLHKAFKNVKFDYKVIRNDRFQPERKKGAQFGNYKKRVVSEKRVSEARAKINANYAMLAAIENKYGVEKEVLVALWAVESAFGNVIGDYNVVNSLATLAYDGRRNALFQSELIHALKMLDRQEVTPEGFVGSWAGAFGQTQFMPSTFNNYAVDGDGDGRKDVWYNQADALASAANYLSSIGWVHGMGWGKRAVVPQGFDMRYLGKDYSLPMSEWKKLGVRYADGSNLQNSDKFASLVDPDARDGDRTELYLVNDNFKKILEWNNSVYFATSIGLIADEIK